MMEIGWHNIRKFDNEIKSVDGDLGKIGNKPLKSTFGRLQAVKQIEGKKTFSALHTNLNKIISSKGLFKRGKDDKRK